MLSSVLCYTAVLAGEEEEAYITWLVPKTIRSCSSGKESWAGALSGSASCPCQQRLWPPQHPALCRGLLSRESCSSRHFLVMETKWKHCRFITNGNAGILFIFMAEVLLLSLLAIKMGQDYVWPLGILLQSLYIFCCKEKDGRYKNWIKYYIECQ